MGSPAHLETGLGTLFFLPKQKLLRGVFFDKFCLLGKTVCSNEFFWRRDVYWCLRRRHGFSGHRNYNLLGGDTYSKNKINEVIENRKTHKKLIVLTFQIQSVQ